MEHVGACDTNKFHKSQNQIKPCLNNLGSRPNHVETFSSHRLEYLNNELNDIRAELKIEFSRSISNYWKKVINISKKDLAKMFPKINGIFRKKQIIEIATLKIAPNSPIIYEIDIDKNFSH